MEEKLENIRFGKRSIQKLLISLFLFFAVFTPADSLNLKLFFFSIILLINISLFLDFYRKKENLYLLFYTLIFPAILFIVSLILTGNFSDTLKYFYVFTYLLLIPIVERYKIDYIKIFMNCLNIISLTIVLSSLLDLLGILSIYVNPLLQFLSTNGEAQISLSMYAIFKYVLFLKGSPLLIISLCYYTWHYRLGWATVSFLGLILSGTRANIYMALMAIVVLAFINNRSRWLKPIFLIVLILIVILFGGNFIDKVETINWAKSTGDSIRELNAQSILLSMKSNPLSYFIGNGAMSAYYGLGRGEYLMTSELSYLELFRQTGLLGIIPFGLFLLRPLATFVVKKNSWLLIGYSFYLIKCVFDPFLFTSTGFLLYVLVYYEMRRGQENDLLSNKIY
ncbi:O-antigen ligase family protein [Enterococcus sp. LJL51]|uniref:O-antigen ligase family protein n=1 Tax=Enterococcus sp. LJL51 TaxID=3416656 RepID=UPI003CEECF67